MSILKDIKNKVCFCLNMIDLPKPIFQVVHLEKLYDDDGKQILPHYIETLLLKLIRMKAHPTFNQETPYPKKYLRELEGFLLVHENYKYYLIHPEEYDGQRLGCLIYFQEPLDSLQRSKYHQLLSGLFCLRPQTLIQEEEDRVYWKKLLANTNCNII